MTLTDLVCIARNYDTQMASAMLLACVKAFSHGSLYGFDDQ